MDMKQKIDGMAGISESSSKRQKQNALSFFRVSANDEGVGLPYAPADFPEAGDHWTWKVGSRITAGGYFRDRYLYPPSRFPEGRRGKEPVPSVFPEAPRGKKPGVNSRQAVKEFVQSRFPYTDPEQFLASFSWKIPAKEKAVYELEIDYVKDGNHDKKSIEPSVDKPCCKAGNISCPSLAQNQGDSPRLMICKGGCCDEPRYCRECTCIICGLSGNSEHEEFKYHIRCNSVEDGAICGHLAHIKCAVGAYNAGTVGGSISLDAQYYCRHCHLRMDLIPLAENLLNSCMSSTSRESVEMIIELGFNITRGSTRSSAQSLFARFSSARSMLMNGANLEDIWKEK